MGRKWLVLDVDYLGYRALHSTGNLEHGEVSTGVIYGVLREVLSLMETYGTKRIAFCFDHGPSLRQRDYPTYKRSRKVREEADPVYAEIKQDMKRQVRLLRKEILPNIGFQNIFFQSGYEADDCIASVVENTEDKCIIVSADKDLFQLLGPGIRIWNPAAKKLYTAEIFSQEYFVSPLQWIDVKSIAGCSSDEIAGVVGVGEKTAAKFISGQLKPSSAAYEKIIRGNRIWKKNRFLVRLPYPGTEPFRPKTDREITRDRWKKILLRYGIKSLISHIPVY